MASHFKQAEIQQILDYRDNQNLSYQEIAEKIGRLTKDGKPDVRAVAGQYNKAKKNCSVSGTVMPNTISSIGDIELAQPQPTQRPDLNELTRKQRVEFLKGQIPASARGRHIFTQVLSSDEQELFLEEYFNVLREEDSITSAEEQQLFNAILHLVLAWRASAQDRQCWLRSPLAGYTGNDSQIYTDTFKKDYQENMKKYNDFMRTLKLSREQRLKDLQRQGTTFLDFAEKFAKNDEQARAIEEILKLEAASQKELSRLQENGWLIAGELSGNKPPRHE